MFPVAMYFFVYIVLAYVHLYTYDICYLNINIFTYSIGLIISTIQVPF